MNTRPTKEVLEIAEVISRYLSERPGAAETVEGITKWWLARLRYNDSTENVEAALNHLILEGEVTALKTGGGKTIYQKASSGS